MPHTKAKPKFKKKRRGLMILLVSLIGLFVFAAVVRIGVGDAEWAGMTVANLTPNLATEFNIPPDEQGVVICWVEEEAFYSGLKEGDFLKAINNHPVSNIREFLNVAKTVDISAGVLLDILRNRKPLYVTLEDRQGLHGMIKDALNLNSGHTGQAPSGSNGASGAFVPVALQNPVAPATPPMGSLPTPKQQGASKKILVEGHWVGMELIPLTPELATEYRIPKGTQGLLVDEISLESAESGILAGDMVVAVAGFKTPDLVAFTEATRRVKNKTRAEVLVSRRGMLLKFTMRAERTLGFSQNEAAQPIQPGAISPHRSRNKPCTECHIIMLTGGQLPTDAGDILPNPPPIVKGAVAPHAYRGECKNCHVILRK
ncbi:MAG: magnetochrome domain-containing protein [Candidatus Omnitrophica bacterium]|nr:magnetochrome domain-containing protein [Candidatus Omnitrophota bacterium]